LPRAEAVKRRSSQPVVANGAPPACIGAQEDRKGTVTAGKLADPFILDDDIAKNLTNSSRVRALIRSGPIIWRK
jgi:predicted amidohydrolase YtcJ